MSSPKRAKRLSAPVINRCYPTPGPIGPGTFFCWFRLRQAVVFSLHFCAGKESRRFLGSAERSFLYTLFSLFYFMGIPIPTLPGDEKGASP